jgi:proteasome assembly chaperone (PAC2) family protein
MPQPTADALQWLDKPALSDATMLLAFSGWMDGGDVSTGTVERLVDQLDAPEVAYVDPEEFYIYNFPGNMEVSALFRPHIRIKRGVLRDIDLPTNAFYADTAHNLAFFVGKEPNLKWATFGECIYAAAKQLDVRRILFVGSFAGSVPHTREPRLYATVSHKPSLRDLKRYGVRPSDYEGPGSFVTYMMNQADRRGMEVISLAAEIPAYIQGTNPLSIEAVTRRLAAILGLPADLSELRTVSNEWESKVTDAVEKDEDLADKIRELEAEYDDDLIKFEAETE